MERLLGGAARALGWGVVAVGLAMLVAAVAVPGLTGWVPLTVLSGSMSPALPVGSQVVVRPLETAAEVDRLRVGDVVTFLPGPADSTTVTHRIVAKRHRADGTPVFTTRGDANGAPDPWPLTRQQIRGEVVYHVPYAGYAARLLENGQRARLSLLVAAGLLVFAAVQVVQALRRPTRKPAGPTRLGP